MPDRAKVEEWERDFKAYVDELDIARDAYRGIVEYIDDAVALFRETVNPCESCQEWECDGCEFAMLKEQEPVVHCKDCVKRGYDNCPFNEFSMYTPEDNFYCGEGTVKWDN